MSIAILIFKIMLNNEPATNSIGLNPNNGFKNIPINRRIYADIEELNDDKTVKPKILFFGRLM